MFQGRSPHLLHVGERRLQGLAPGEDQDGSVAGQLMAEVPGELTEETLGPIPEHGGPKTASHNNADPRVGLRRRARHQVEERGLVPTAFPFDVLNVPASAHEQEPVQAQPGFAQDTLTPSGDDAPLHVAVPGPFAHLSCSCVS